MSNEEKRGRPTIYSEELIEEFLNRIIEGESLRSICRDENMPALRTVMNWISKDEIFMQQYTHAKKLQVDLKMDAIVETARTADPENVQCVRLVVDAMKWEASKLIPKKYGDKLDLNHSGKVNIEEKRPSVVFVKSKEETEKDD